MVLQGNLVKQQRILQQDKRSKSVYDKTKNLAGIAPKIADQGALQAAAQTKALQGLGSFEPFVQRAQHQADLASGFLQLGSRTIRNSRETLGGVPLGAQAFQQDVQQFMSPYQSQVIDATLAEFDRNKAIQEQGIRDQQAALGALGVVERECNSQSLAQGLRENVRYYKQVSCNKDFNQAAAQRQQDIQNRFGLGTAQQGLAGATQGLGGFRSGLAGQQAQLGAGLQGLQGTDISRLGQLGALNQAQRQAALDATRDSYRMAAFQPQEELNRFADITTGIMGGMRGTGTTTQNIPNPTPLQTALGVGTTLAGIYGAINNPGKINFSLPGFSR